MPSTPTPSLEGSASWENSQGLPAPFRPHVGHLHAPALGKTPPNFSFCSSIGLLSFPMNSHSLLQRIFLTQGSNPCLPHCRQILYHLSHQENLYPVNTCCLFGISWSRVRQTAQMLPSAYIWFWWFVLLSFGVYRDILWANSVVNDVQGV